MKKLLILFILLYLLAQAFGLRLSYLLTNQLICATVVYLGLPLFYIYLFVTTV